jgi:hypothetical protein
MNTDSTSKLATSRTIWAAFLATTLLFFTGCASSGPPRIKPIALALDIQPVGDAARLTIPVYIGAANQFYEKSLMEDDVDEILERFREKPFVDVKSFQLTTRTNISRTDPKWSHWSKRKDHLVLIADIPKNYGAEKRRRVSIPLDRRLWRHLPKDKIVHIEVRETGVKLLDTPGI